MAVGNHYTLGDWNNRAYHLFQLFTQFCDEAEKVAQVDSANDNAFYESLGFSETDVANLKTGIACANALRKVAQGDTSQGVLDLASQADVFLKRFGDF